MFVGKEIQIDNQLFIVESHSKELNCYVLVNKDTKKAFSIKDTVLDVYIKKDKMRKYYDRC